MERPRIIAGAGGRPQVRAGRRRGALQWRCRCPPRVPSAAG